MFATVAVLRGVHGRMIEPAVAEVLPLPKKVYHSKVRRRKKIRTIEELEESSFQASGL